MLSILEKYFKFKYRLKRFDSLGNIFEPIQVNPNNVNYLINEKIFNEKIPIFGIKGGDWDIQSYPIKDSRECRLFIKYFKNKNKISEMTEYYSIIKSIEEEDGFGGLDSKNQTAKEYHKYIQYWNDIYTDINVNGYKSQNELRSGFINRLFRPPVLDEVQIFVGRDGRLICKSGKHRLIAAQVLDIDSIPARVSLRHENWQIIRQTYAKKGVLPSDVRENHPDLQDIS